MNPENMTPEQMAALAKQQCIFCQIASGAVASRKIYEDEKVVAVLDINPANPGHVLLITKEHYVVMPQIPDDAVAHIGMVAKGISHALLRALKAQGTTIFVANGVAAGQRAQHFMLHIIPRMENDGIGIDYAEHKIDPADFKKIHAALKKGAAKAMGQMEGLEEETEQEEEMIEEAEEKIEKKKEKETGKAAAKEEEELEEAEEEPEETEEAEEEPEEKEKVTLEEAAKGKKKAKKTQSKKKTKKKKEEPEEADEERQKLDQIAGMLTGR